MRSGKIDVRQWESPIVAATLTAPNPALLAVAVLVQVWVSLLRRAWWRIAIGGTVVAAWFGMLVWELYLKLRELIAGLDFLVLGLLLLPLAIAVSLFNGGVLSRWWRFWVGRIPTPAP